MRPRHNDQQDCESFDKIKSERQEASVRLSDDFVDRSAQSTTSISGGPTVRAQNPVVTGSPSVQTHSSKSKSKSRSSSSQLGRRQEGSVGADGEFSSGVPELTVDIRGVCPLATWAPFVLTALTEPSVSGELHVVVV